MRVYGLIGYPLGHSMSQHYFNEKFKTESLLDCRFELFPIDKISHFPFLIESEPELTGLAVTIPYKEAVIPYLSAIDEEANKIQAVNCITFSGIGMKGYNTDIIGFEKSFIPLLKPHHKKAIILGSGGASKAVQFVLEKIGMEFLIVSRKKSSDSNRIGYELLEELLWNDYYVIINCTPIGMDPHFEKMPNIPYSLLNEKYLLYDLIYKPSETLFMQMGIRSGATVKNGYEMLLIQAEENWKLWNK